MANKNGHYRQHTQTHLLIFNTTFINFNTKLIMFNTI